MLSVVVCTYNRAAILSECLRSLAKQSLGKENYEVIIVDNNSTDATGDVVHEYQHRELNFRICHECKPGANHARNTGARIAYGKYLIFIDDDAVAYSDWLQKIQEFIVRQPTVAVFGGPYEAFSKVLRPNWFPPEYGSLYLGDKERPIRFGSEWITGTNLIVRKDVFFDVGGFHHLLGSVKNGIFYFGEESRLIVDLYNRGYIPYYVPSVRVKHLIRPEKFSLFYLLKSNYLMGRNHCLTLDTARTLQSYGISLAVTFFSAVVKMLVYKPTPLKRRLYYAFYPLCYELGALIEYIVPNTDVT